jgi:hypothetical protein
MWPVCYQSSKAFGSFDACDYLSRQADVGGDSQLHVTKVAFQRRYVAATSFKAFTTAA